MASTSSTKHTFTGLCVYEKDHCYVSSIVDEMVDEGNQDHCLVFLYDSGTWFHRPIPFAVGGMGRKSTSPKRVLTMGVAGETNLFTHPGAPGAATEHIDKSSNGPSDLIPLRAIREIGQSMYACGMARRVYRRGMSEKWSAIDKGVFVPKKERKKSVGLNSIDGFDESTIYAVGYQGEIWFYDGKSWKQQTSPTDAVLTVVRCESDGAVYASGMGGVFLRKVKNGDWESLRQRAVKDDIWGMTYFKKNLYVSTNKSVYLLEGKELKKINMGLSKPISTSFLDSNEEIMWSVGNKDIAETKTGQAWRVIPAPN